MKAYKKRLRALRSWTIAACAFGLAASGAAGAKPLPPDPPVTVLHPHGRPALVVHTSQPRGSSTYVLPASHKTDVQSSGRTQAPVQPPVAITREVRTVTDHGDRTLAIVLAAAALGIALCGTGYAAVRLANLQRRVAGSSS
jgi:hypothetical protein